MIPWPVVGMTTISVAVEVQIAWMGLLESIRSSTTETMTATTIANYDGTGTRNKLALGAEIDKDDLSFAHLGNHLIIRTDRKGDQLDGGELLLLVQGI